MGKCRLLILMAAFASGAVATAFGASAQAQVRPQDRGGLRDAFEQGMRGSIGAPVLEAVERNYPGELEPLIDRAFAMAMRSLGDRDAMLAGGVRLFAEFGRSKIDDLARSPTASLRRLMEQRLAIFESLAADEVELCGALATTGPTPAMMDVAHRQRFDALAIALLDAAGDGRRTPQSRATREASEQETTAWTRAILGYEDGAEIFQLLGNPTAMLAATSDRRCRAIIYMYRGLRDMPPEHSANLFVLFLRAEFGAGQAAGAGTSG